MIAIICVDIALWSVWYRYIHLA